MGDLNTRDNALNFVRLVLAAVVIIGHSWPIPGFGRTPLIGGMDLGHAAVGGFFGISGFLIAGSRDRLPMREFLQRRCRRILPAFWVCLAVTAFAFAPLAAGLTGAAWRPDAASRYLLENSALFVFRPTIPGTLDDAPWISTWNGSLWTIAMEFAAYLLVAVLFTSTLFRDRPIPGLVVAHGEFALIALLTGANAAWLGAFFTAGMLLWAMGPRFKPSWGVLAGSLLVIVVLCRLDLLWQFGALPVATLVLTAGAVLPVRMGATNDLSYGAYLYGFPVQQLLVVLGLPAVSRPWQFAMVSLATVVPFAVASWFLVERPAQRRSQPWRVAREAVETSAGIGTP